jgi:GNAT superfamily N-acetyltransferase
MKVSLHHTRDEFAPVARSVYLPDPVTYTVELTTLRTPPAEGCPVMVSVTDGAALGAAVQLGDAALLTTGLPPACAADVAAALTRDHSALPGVRGTRDSTTAFATAWSEATGMPAELTEVEPLYRLDALVPPAGVPGEGRLAVGREVDLLVDWLDGFFVEAFGAPSDRDARRAYLHQIALTDGDIVLWTTGGTPVSMARVHAPLAGMSRIGPVYTPREHRGHGYAAAVTAAAARHAHHRGADDVVLFADATNAVANRVYRRIGFVTVDEHVQYAFG